MPAKDVSPSERIANRFKQLKASAAALNAASDELGKSISALDAALKRLNLGISAWEFIVSHLDQSTGEFSNQKIGYCKVQGRWGIALSTAEGFVQDPDGGSQEIWLFNDAPRALRVEAIEKLPDLLEKLVEEADTTTAKITEKTTQAREFAEVVNAAATARK